MTFLKKGKNNFENAESHSLFCNSYTISPVFLLTMFNSLDKTRGFLKFESVATELSGSRLGFFFEKGIVRLLDG